jgi:hypothetical protein
MDSPHNLGGKYMSQLHSVPYRLHLFHMGMAYRELVFLVPPELKNKCLQTSGTGVEIQNFQLGRESYKYICL